MFFHIYNFTENIFAIIFHKVIKRFDTNIGKVTFGIIEESASEVPKAYHIVSFFAEKESVVP